MTYTAFSIILNYVSPTFRRIVWFGVEGKIMEYTDFERKIFRNRYFRGYSDESYDEDIQFFHFYALFDQLFKTYANQQKKKMKLEETKFLNDELSKMKYYLYNIFYKEDVEKAYFVTFNPFATLKNGNRTSLLESLETKNKTKLDVAQYCENYELPPFDVMAALFAKIYLIRNSLFHGDSDLSGFKNKKLIEDANIVLKDFLGRLFPEWLEVNSAFTKNKQIEKGELL